MLQFSDEFETDGRTFYDGDDAYFQGVDLWYGVTEDLEWYDPDAITTKDGTLQITFDAFENHNLNYRSGMLQSWNKLCFKGGHIEASISLPGAGDTIGFWPGFWAMGNLGRPGYAATTDGTWPYSYHDECDVGITPNQSMPDGLSWLPGMRLPACTCDGEDHPSPGNSRSAPEIDAIEASVTYLDPPALAAIGTASQSFQVAPFDIFWRPNTGEWASLKPFDDLSPTCKLKHVFVCMNGRWCVSRYRCNSHLSLSVRSICYQDIPSLEQPNALDAACFDNRTHVQASLRQ